MRDDFDGLWEERKELLNIDNECLCDDFGIENCLIHNENDLEILDGETIEKLSRQTNRKKRKTTSKKVRKVSLDRMQEDSQE